ncbi:MAG: type II secretion system GspH family protein [Candidatus Margulisbacteria bacterium]|nr:type II secretion system GspH family protein [Candidatus Margulisiibacteriota bacterium]
MRKGFTLIELLIVMSVVAILVSIIVPSFRAMQQEAWISKAEKEVQTIQMALESYYRHHRAYPSNITTTLTETAPKIITQTLKDPWDTDINNQTYGFVTKNVGNNTYYVIYSQGINAQKNWDWASDGTAKVVLESDCDDIIQTNAKIE